MWTAALLCTAIALPPEGIWTRETQTKQGTTFTLLEFRQITTLTKLKRMTLVHVKEGVHFDGTPYRQVQRASGFYSVEERNRETLLRCRLHETGFQDALSDKPMVTWESDEVLTFHLQIVGGDEAEIRFTSDDRRNLIGWPVDEKWKLKKLVAKKP